MDTVIAANSSVSNPNDVQAGQTINIPDEFGTPFTVTAYTAGKESTGKQPGDPGYGVTASGKEVQENRTLACPPSLAFGTKVHIPELNQTYTCEDRGSAITNGRLDVFVADLDDALEFGVKELQVQIME
jgi:3D (Asp-Asp-Asp) domain-containing protein